jgi:hypothetical protein
VHRPGLLPGSVESCSTPFVPAPPPFLAIITPNGLPSNPQAYDGFHNNSRREMHLPLSHSWPRFDVRCARAMLLEPQQRPSPHVSSSPLPLPTVRLAQFGPITPLRKLKSNVIGWPVLPLGREERCRQESPCRACTRKIYRRDGHRCTRGQHQAHALAAGLHLQPLHCHSAATTGRR